ncbi:MAG: DUF2059 domain-containing protein [Reyranella sp.]
MKAIRMFIGSTALVVAMAAGVVGQGLAQDNTITESHLAAAHNAVTSARTAETFDNILPSLSDQVQSSLILQRPDLHREIAAAVNAMALTLTSRRSDLDNDIARVWAKAFTEDELRVITEFYRSPAGAKLAQVGPQVLQDTLQVAQGWSERVGEELLEKSKEELKRQGIEF